MSTGIVSTSQLGLFGDDELASFVSGHREDQWFERKGRKIEARALAEVIIGLANAEGGLIVLGVTDSGVIEGTDEALENAWRATAAQFTVPPVRHRFSVLPCRVQAEGVKRLVVIEVESSEFVHRNTRDEVYLRVGDETRKLTTFQARELEFDKGQSFYDRSIVPDADIAEFDQKAIDRFLAALRPFNTGSDVLEARRLLVRKDGVLRPTVAGMLLLGAEPQRFFPQAFVRVVEYADIERGYGERANVLSDRRYEGTLTAQIESARRALKRRLPTVTRLGSRGRFAPATLLPEGAWLEAIVNAVVHRSYSMAGDHIRVEFFPNRLEVHSPGRLPGLVRVDNIRSTRFARNPHIARCISDMGFGRELGEGVDRMFEEMHRAGYPDPQYRQEEASVRVVLSAEPGIALALQQLTPQLRAVFELFQRYDRLTTSEAMELIGRSRPTVLTYLKQLEQRGLVRHSGSATQDPRGAWQRAVPPSNQV